MLLQASMLAPLNIIFITVYAVTTSKHIVYKFTLKVIIKHNYKCKANVPLIFAF